MYRIKEWRSKRGLTQGQLAKISGVSRTIISKLETCGGTVTSTKTLKRIADALGVAVSDIFLKEMFNLLNERRKP